MNFNSQVARDIYRKRAGLSFLNRPAAPPSLAELKASLAPSPVSTVNASPGGCQISS
ncbi:hypothetical protein CUJ84_Chr003629 [Rhizobium leguminosarum]|uniref:Uncharacterized protein n=1 Tax=Rhizobium leguminosarum TaxID=384 RepID=A0A2K9Z6Z9_RHILE|nr:hypothetical protein CUJ84_Chr003629 [Rhizobium leguminosarum]